MAKIRIALCALVLALLVSCPVQGEDLNNIAIKPGVQAVFLVKVNGQYYQVTKLTDTRKVGKLKYYTYEVLDSLYPLTVDENVYKDNKKMLKEVPDFRPEQQRHPVKDKIEKWSPVINLAISALGLFL